jgi:AbiV family abortive infection protein
MFGREELGRYKILRELADEVAGGRSMTPAEVQALCEDHEEKQRAAVFSSTMRADRGTRLGDALMTRMREPRTSEAWRDANETVEAATDAKIERTPQDRVRLREKSFYVDISASGLGWSRPVDITPTEARNAIVDAANDYVPERDRRINFPEDDPRMAEAFKTITPAPVSLMSTLEGYEFETTGCPRIGSSSTSDGI